MDFEMLLLPSKHKKLHLDSEASHLDTMGGHEITYVAMSFLAVPGKLTGRLFCTLLAAMRP